jgi:transcriptional regulator
MYLPKHFEQHDPAALRALLQAHPLATVVVCGADGLQAEWLPMEYDAAAGPHGSLRGHVARSNTLWQRAGSDALALFHGPQAYVSPSWYPSKRQHGKAVPTWNYAVIEARGRLVAIDDPAWMQGFLRQLTQRHEAGRTEPWDISDAPMDYTERMLRAVVGVEIVLASPLRGKWKVSQNRDAADRDGVAAGLEADGHAQAAAMVPHGEA